MGKGDLPHEAQGIMHDVTDNHCYREADSTQGDGKVVFVLSKQLSTNVSTGGLNASP